MKILLIGFIALVISVAAVAQQRPSLAVLVEDIDSDGIRCGLSKSALESIATLTLRNNGIQVGSDFRGPYLAVETTALPNGNTGCVVNITMKIKTIRLPDAISIIKPRRDYLEVIFCYQGNLLMGANAGMAKRVNDALENQIKICLGTLDY